MKTTKKAALEQERETARQQLREIFPAGSTVLAVLRHRSSSGMSRAISLIAHTGDDISDVSYLVARATGDKIDQNHGGIRISGCGTDMGFALVYQLASVLYPKGFECAGSRCPANDHFNGDRNYEPHHHNDGGYALKHRWL